MVNGGGGGEIGLLRGPVEDAERGRLVALAAEGVEELLRSEVGREVVGEGVVVLRGGEGDGGEVIGGGGSVGEEERRWVVVRGVRERPGEALEAGRESHCGLLTTDGMQNGQARSCRSKEEDERESGFRSRAWTKKKRTKRSVYEVDDTGSDGIMYGA